jgi:hypothetical protein
MRATTVLAVMLAATTAGADPLRDVLARAFVAAEHGDRIGDAWTEALAHGVAASDANRATFARALFIWHLVRHEGALGNRFLIREGDGRHPDVMLRDAFRPAPRWRVVYERGWEGHAERGGDVFAYGRCDEIEMESAGLMRALFGLHARIVLLSPDHVVTEVALDGDGGYLRLDASFLRCVTFARTRLVDAPPEDGVYSVARTNQLASRDLHADRAADGAGVARVERALATYFASHEASSVFCALREPARHAP